MAKKASDRRQGRFEGTTRAEMEAMRDRIQRFYANLKAICVEMHTENIESIMLTKRAAVADAMEVIASMVAEAKGAVVTGTMDL